MPQPIAKWNPARDVWETDQACICGHSDVFSETFPISGTTRAGTAYAQQMSAPRMDDSGSSSLLPTPSVADGMGGHLSSDGHQTTLPGVARDISLLPTPQTSDTNGPGEHGTGGLDLRTAISSLPLEPLTAPRVDRTSEARRAI